MKTVIKHNVFFFISILFVISNTFSQANKTSEDKIILLLIEQFSDENPFTNGEAITKIVRYGDIAVEQLIKTLTDKNENVRWCSAVALSKIAPRGKRETYKEENESIL